MHRPVAFTVLFLCSFPSLATPQATAREQLEQARVGNWYVRALRADSSAVEGRVQSVDSIAEIGQRTIRVSEIDAIQRRYNVGGGWMKGAFVGALAGAWLGYEFSKFCESDCSGQQLGGTLLMAAIVAIPGSVIGQIVSPPTHAWRRVWLRNAR